MAKQSFFSRLFFGERTNTTAEQEQVEVAPVDNKAVRRKLARRDFAAAKASAVFADWAMNGLNSVDKEIEDDLHALRTRSRDTIKNNPFGKRYIQVLSDNVIGAHGITLKMDIRNRDGARDETANANIETDWKNYSKSVSTSGMNLRHTLITALRMCAVDGEVFLVKRTGSEFGNFFVQWQMFESDWVPHKYNSEVDKVRGRYIRNGIEYDAYSRPVAYYFVKQHPKEQKTRPTAYNTTDMIRIPAEDVIHLYDPMRSTQGRGYPWMTPVMIQLQHLKEYTESEQIAARVSAAKMGFYTRPRGEDGLDVEDDEFTGSGVLRDAIPGAFEELPEGYELEMFNPTHPNGNFDTFQKAVLHSIASGLGLSFMTLTTDINSANYSSARLGAMNEREMFRNLQQWLIEQCLTKMFEAFLESVLEFSPGVSSYPSQRFEKFNSPTWRPRTWESVDPAKEIQASRTKVALNVMSRSELIRQHGMDPDTVFAEIAEENAKAREMGIELEIENLPNNETLLTGDDSNENPALDGSVEPE
jgi:lambda family phage portal protein